MKPVMFVVLSRLGGVMYTGCEPRVQHAATVAPTEDAHRAILKASWAIEDAASAAEANARWFRLEAARAEAWSVAPSEGGKDQ